MCLLCVLSQHVIVEFTAVEREMAWEVCPPMHHSDDGHGINGWNQTSSITPSSPIFFPSFLLFLFPPSIALQAKAAISILQLRFRYFSKPKSTSLPKAMATAKADSAVLPSAAVDVDASKAKGHRRGSSSVTDVYKPAELSMSMSLSSLYLINYMPL